MEFHRVESHAVLQKNAERVDAALRGLLASRSFTAPQRQWLQRIAKQMKLETVVDREALGHGSFRGQGGFARFDRIFEGRMEEVLADLHGEVWAEDERLMG